jgi:fructose-bisphosphate aldolase class II
MSRLCTLNDVLPGARRGGYAVPGFDCVNDLYIRAVLDAAEEERSPVIIMALGHDLAGRGIDFIAGLVHAVAPTYSVPVVLHLDHATDLDLVMRCIDHGFTSVMFDGSALPAGRNIELTRQVVELAHPHGISVEAELGCVAGKEITGKDIGKTVLTDPEDVPGFVRSTGIDALAVSIGTAHGVYAKKPKLDIERLRAINAVCPVPLVMHGGSGTPDDQVRAAISNGVTKFNVYADVRIALNQSLSKAMQLVDERSDELTDVVFGPVRDAVAGVAKAKMRMAMSSRKVPA